MRGMQTSAEQIEFAASLISKNRLIQTDRPDLLLFAKQKRHIFDSRTLGLAGAMRLTNA
jgi:hypothetical protein